MKVLHIIWSSNIGGIESVVLQLACIQKENEVITPTIFASKSDGPLIQTAHEKNLELIKGGFSKKQLNISKIFYCLQIFKKFDVLHLHSFNPVIALAAILSKKKIVFTEHGNFAFERNQRLTEKINKFLQKIFINNFINGITFNSEFSKKVAYEKYQIRNVLHQVVYNGIDLPKAEVDCFTESSTFRIGFVGRLVEVKRVDRLIEVINKIQNNESRNSPNQINWSRPITVDIIGDGPLRTSLEKRVQQLKLSNQISFLGYQSSIGNFYKNWDLLIAPSSNEAFGLIAIEAYSYGCPVAVFDDGGGLAEIVGKCEPSMIFQSTENLSNWIANLLTKSSPLNEVKQRIYRRDFASQFSIHQMEKSIKQVYLSL
ncbi:MAG: glycosyltransferase family 4 protein [Bacteroidota bacterium]